MKTYERICIKDFKVTAENGDCFEITRGGKYITAKVEKGKVKVFTRFLFDVPVSYFAGEKIFTK